jgi:NADPH:quinone reductase-like Zn-dependent oxidoreductase
VPFFLHFFDTLEDVQQPTIADYDVLIKLRAAGVNPIDYLTVSNIPGIKPLPHIPGVEVTGVIENSSSPNKSVTLPYPVLISFNPPVVCPTSMI